MAYFTLTEIQKFFSYIERNPLREELFSTISETHTGVFAMAEDFFAGLENIKIRLGNQLETARRSRHWTLNDVARRIGRQPGRISEMEGGKANSTVQSLSEVGEAVGLSLIFVPNDRIADVLNIVGTARPQPRPPVEVTTAYDDVFIRDDAIVDDEGPRARP